MASVRKSAAPAKTSRIPRAPKLALVPADAPPPVPAVPRNAFLLPHGRAMAAEIVRPLLAAYMTFREHYHAWLRYEDDHSFCDDPVSVEREREIASLGPSETLRIWPETIWRWCLEEVAGTYHMALVRGVIIASGQVDDASSIAHSNGNGTPWTACAVELDGRLIVVAPEVCDGEDGGGQPSYGFEFASLIILDGSNVTHLGQGPRPPAG